MRAKTPLLRRSLAWCMVAGVAACTDGASGSARAAAQAGRWTLPLEQRSRDPFPREFTNLTGDSYTIKVPPQRIASATLFTDVVLLAICPQDRIAALHEISKRPLFSPVAEASQRFPRHVTPDPESVRVVRPDLVFLASFSDKRSDSLVSGAGCPVIRLHQLSSIEGVQQSIRNVGYVTGLDVPAEQLVATMQDRLDRVAVGKDGRRRWRVLSWDSGFVAGRGTIFDDVIGYVGAVNAAAEAGFEGTTKVGPERLMTLWPDAIVIGVPPGEEVAARARLQSLNGMKQLAAVQKDRVVYAPNNLMMSASHHVAEFAELIAAAIDGWNRSGG